MIKQVEDSTSFEFGAAKVLFDRLNICVYVDHKPVDKCSVQEFSKHPNATFRRLQRYAEGVSVL